MAIGCERGASRSFEYSSGVLTPVAAGAQATRVPASNPAVRVLNRWNSVVHAGFLRVRFDVENRRTVNLYADTADIIGAA